VSPVVEITAASRLHFGMFSFGHDEARQFGGMGAMIAVPGLRVRIVSADALMATGPLAERVLKVASRIVESADSAQHSNGCCIEVLSAPREHVGLGVGTQLALSIAAGLRRFFGLPDLTPHELAALAGRGERSAIGTYGFFQGGWLIEAGKRAGETLSPLVNRFAIPGQWRFVLIMPKNLQGLYGQEERRAFVHLPPVPADVTQRLTRMAMDEIVPAITSANFAAVSESLYHFNREAGLCFAARQHGAYANEATTKIVERLRSWGIAGVGQSSWGPTVFALQPDEPSAVQLMDRLRRETLINDYDVILAPPANEGAQIVSSPRT
jgi:beta-ribofuranosylaminobenzene 5'-phosphate synthase